MTERVKGRWYPPEPVEARDLTRQEAFERALRSLVGDHLVHPAHMPDCDVCVALNGPTRGGWAEPVEARDLTARLMSMAASMVRGEGVCERPHRNGEANPHVHFDDRYIARGRDLSNIARALRADTARVPEGLDVERLAEVLHREDVTGRAIHEDAFAMQVPTFPALDCWACKGAARDILAALATSPEGGSDD